MEWILKYHSRRELWILESPMRVRVGFETEAQAVRYADYNGLQFRKVEPDKSDRVPSGKTERRRERRCPRVPEETGVILGDQTEGSHGGNPSGDAQ